VNDKPVILVVDDSTMDIQILVSILKDDYHIRIAKNGMNAFDLIYQGLKPDLIILDVMMPVMDGYEFLEKFNECSVCSYAPVVFITGSDTLEDEEKAFSLGGVDYIKKPFRPSIVKARVKTHISIVKQREEILYHTSRDPLTNLYNLEHFIQEGERKFTRASRHNAKLSLIVIDIDNLKEINERYNYITGYKVLRDVSVAIEAGSRRNEDFLAKFVGDEFAIMLEDCSGADAKLKANELREAIKELRPEDIDVTISIGVNELSKAHKDFKGFLKDANEALEMAKANGGNRVVLFTDEEL